MIINNNKSIFPVYSGTTRIKKIMKGILKVYEAWERLKASGIFPLILNKCKASNLVDYKIYGDTIQEEVSLIDIFDISTQEGLGTYIGSGEEKTAYFIPTIVGRTYNIKVGFKDENDIPIYVYFSKRDADLKITRVEYITTSKIENTDITFVAEEGYEYFIYRGGQYLCTQEEMNKFSYCDVKQENAILSPETPMDFKSVGEYDEATGKYKIPVKARGKNHLNIEHLGNISNWDTAPTYASYEISLPNGNYYFNYETDLQNYSGHILILNKRKSVATGAIDTLINGSNNIQSTQGSFTISNNEKIYLNWYCGNKNQSNLTKLINDILNKFIIEDGDIFTGYEPYVEPVITNIYLDEPLRKTGDYVDYIDFKKQLVVRKIYNEFITKVNSKSSLSGIYSVFLTPISKKPYIVNDGPSVNYSVGFAQSNKFIQNTTIYGDLVHKGGYIQTYKTTAGSPRVAYTFNDKAINTVALAQEKIGDGFDVNYVLEEEIEEPIELPNIPILKGTTILEVDTKIQPSNAEVIYIGKP